MPACAHPEVRRLLLIPLSIPWRTQTSQGLPISKHCNCSGIYVIGFNSSIHGSEYLCPTCPAGEPGAHSQHTHKRFLRKQAGSLCSFPARACTTEIYSREQTDHVRLQRLVQESMHRIARLRQSSAASLHGSRAWTSWLH